MNTKHCEQPRGEATLAPVPKAHEQQEPWEHLKAYGYAPGGYMMTCRGCNTTVIEVDKRASRCKPCAIKAFKAQQQEPVWIQPNHLQKARQAPFLCRVEPEKRDDFVPLYISPQRSKPWVGLTEKEKLALVEYADEAGLDDMKFIEDIEAKMKEKNGF